MPDDEPQPQNQTPSTPWKVNGATSFNFLGYSVLVAEVKVDGAASTFKTPRGFVPEAFVPSLTVSTMTFAKDENSPTYTVTPTIKNGATVAKAFVIGHY
jgi:hypothetical protein